MPVFNRAKRRFSIVPISLTPTTFLFSPESIRADFSNIIVGLEITWTLSVRNQLIDSCDNSVYRQANSNSKHLGNHSDGSYTSMTDPVNRQTNEMSSLPTIREQYGNCQKQCSNPHTDPAVTFRPQAAQWRKRDLSTDTCYFFCKDQQQDTGHLGVQECGVEPFYILLVNSPTVIAGSPPRHHRCRALTSPPARFSTRGPRAGKHYRALCIIHLKLFQLTNILCTHSAPWVHFECYCYKAT